MMLCGIVVSRDRVDDPHSQPSWTLSILDQLWLFISPPIRSAAPYPTHAYAACRLLESFWQKKREETTNWLRQVILKPLHRTADIALNSPTDLLDSTTIPSLIPQVTFIKVVVEHVAQQSDFVNTVFSDIIPLLYRICTAAYRASDWPIRSQVDRSRTLVLAKSIEGLLVMWIGQMDSSAVLLGTQRLDIVTDSVAGELGSERNISDSDL